MGWNSTVVVLNDALNDIENDSEFGKKVTAGIHHLSVNRGKPVDISAGSHANAAHVVETHHADQTSIVAVGGNLGRVVTELYGWRYEGTEEIFKAMAKHLGYSIRKLKK